MSSVRNTARTEAFSDGVFAIAITLLVFNLKVPDVPNGALVNRQLRQQLLAQWPAYLGFLTSFTTILIIWMKYHRWGHRLINYRADLPFRV